MARISIQQALLQVALDGITDNHSVTVYKRDCKAFAAFCRNELNIKTPDRLRENPLEALQQYEKALEAQHYSPATIHRYLAAPAKGLAVGLQQIEKPKRRSSAIVRGRVDDANTQGQRELEAPRNQRLVQFQRAVGIRRAELADLRGRDLMTDESGQLCVCVVKGKGGKRQLQRILPGDVDVVRSTFLGIEKNQLVFSPDEMNNKINLHAIRADHARDAYKYYENLITNGGAQQLRIELVRRWQTAHPNGNGAKFLDIITNRKPYVLRGDNRKKALAAGLPLKYNRLALMAVSTFHLSHWRLDVTATNYMV